jgi:hypothetical protein
MNPNKESASGPGKKINPNYIPYTHVILVAALALTDHDAEARARRCSVAMVCEQIKALEQSRLANLEQAPGTGPHAMVRLIANVIGVGIETADMLVQEVLSRNLRDRRAVARFAGLTGAANESGCRCGACQQDGAHRLRNPARQDGLSGDSGVRSVGAVRGQAHQEPRRHRSRG